MPRPRLLGRSRPLDRRVYIGIRLSVERHDVVALAHFFERALEVLFEGPFGREIDGDERAALVVADEPRWIDLIGDTGRERRDDEADLELERDLATPATQYAII